jgi:hypothetical protein
MKTVRNTTICVTACCALATLAPEAARADAGGVSFWLPGLFGSLAAAPSQPGWTYTAVYYHTSVEGGRGANFISGGAVVAGLDARADLGTAILTYVFASPVLNGQAAFSVLVPVGRMRTTIDATLTGPLGNTISGSRTDTVGGFADTIWQGTLKWNHGVHNTMVYAMGNFPIGAYESTRLANLGLGHWSVDGGAGYTYFNPQTGYEFEVPDPADPYRRRRLRLSAAHRRQRLRCAPRRFQIAGVRRRSAGRLYLSRLGGLPGLRQSQGL